MFVPQKGYLDHAARLDQYVSVLHFIIAILIVIDLCLSVLTVEWLITLFSVIALIVDILSKHSFKKGEKIRRQSLFNNAYNIVSIDKSKGYYDNDEYKPGLIKLFMNVAQGYTETLYIAQEMKHAKEKWCLTFCLVVVFFIYIINNVNKGVYIIIQVCLSLDLINEFIQLSRFVTSLESLKYNCDKLLGIVLNEEELNWMVEKDIIYFISEYECTLASNSIMLDSKIYNENRVNLDENWENIKKHHLNSM